jgi:hypothetical protein
LYFQSGGHENDSLLEIQSERKESNDIMEVYNGQIFIQDKRYPISISVSDDAREAADDFIKKIGLSRDWKPKVELEMLRSQVVGLSNFRIAYQKLYLASSRQLLLVASLEERAASAERHSAELARSISHLNHLLPLLLSRYQDERIAVNDLRSELRVALEQLRSVERMAQQLEHENLELRFRLDGQPFEGYRSWQATNQALLVEIDALKATVSQQGEQVVAAAESGAVQSANLTAENSRLRAQTVQLRESAALLQRQIADIQVD